MIVKHSEFCQSPQKEIDRILQFCEITISSAKLKKLYDIASTPSSTNRYKNYNLNIFSHEQIQFAKEMGFEIDTSLYTPIKRSFTYFCKGIFLILTKPPPGMLNASSKPAISLNNEVFKKRQLLSPIGPNHPNFEEPAK